MGSVLRDLTQPHTNMFIKCRRSYWRMLSDPWTSPGLRMLLRQCLPLGVEVVDALWQMMMALILTLDYQIWRWLEWKYQDWPFKLCHLVMPFDKKAHSTSQELYGSPNCCLDPGMTRKVSNKLDVYPTVL
eukprot:10165778-Prorocentrum_lima.AAC.1